MSHDVRPGDLSMSNMDILSVETRNRGERREMLDLEAELSRMRFMGTTATHNRVPSGFDPPADSLDDFRASQSPSRSPSRSSMQSRSPGQRQSRSLSRQSPDRSASRQSALDASGQQSAAFASAARTTRERARKSQFLSDSSLSANFWRLSRVFLGPDANPADANPAQADGLTPDFVTAFALCFHCFCG